MPEFDSGEPTDVAPLQRSRPGPITDSLLPPEPQYVLVFQGDSCSMFELPWNATIVIGRHDSCGLVLEDRLVSRAHSEIMTFEGGASIADLGSQNGTYVNGERISGTRLLVSGDVITISGTTLVYHARRRIERPRQMLPFEAFCARASDEIHRAQLDGAPVMLVVLSIGVAWTEPSASDTLLEHTRRVDLVGMGPGQEAIIVMPGIGSAAAEQAAKRLINTLRGANPRFEPRAGYAAAPTHGSDLDTLLASARAAWAAASPGDVSRAGGRRPTLEIGDRTIIVLEPSMQKLYALIERLAKTDLAVILQGETGTGKELAAQALHFWSARKEGPFVPLNCAALPEALAESTLFGHVRGAFSGAVDSKQGLLESASGGTVVLDEIGELPLPIQAKLLRAIETMLITRIGDVEERKIDVRLVASTNRNLKQEVKAGRFREDLFFRLSGGLLWLPPLRDRPQELPVLAEALLDQACKRIGRDAMTVSDEALRRLQAHPWPGNIRELKNLMEYVAAAQPSPVLEPWHLDERLTSGSQDELHKEVAMAALTAKRAGRAPFRPIAEEIRELEESRMRSALVEAGGNQTRAAELIKMPLRTFVTKLKAYGLRSSDPSERGTKTS
jgi:DNA-binding NtrC family response regulator